MPIEQLMIHRLSAIEQAFFYFHALNDNILHGNYHII